MTINLKAPDDHRELRPRITVFGVGGAGGNAVNNMIQAGLEGVEFVVANTDNQALAMSSAERRIQMGTAITEGLGAGSKPQIGGAAAEEAMPEILDQLQGSHMAFITAGMGGGTGTGAAPVIARLAREQGILTIGVVTKPFQFEGARRMAIAEAGIEELTANVDTLIVIPNQNLFRVANERTTFADAFAMADQVLYSGVAGVTDLMVKEGLINLDFADVKTIMSGMGKAMMGTGEASGEKRATEAAEAAIANPLLDDVSMKGARGLLISITGGEDLTLYEVDEAATRIRQEVDPDANIILGATFDQSLEGYIRVSVVATGIDLAAIKEEQPGQEDLAAARANRVREAHAASAAAWHETPGASPATAQDAFADGDRDHDARAGQAPHYDDAGYDDYAYEEGADEGYYEDEAEPAARSRQPAAETHRGYDDEAEVTIRRLDIGQNRAHQAPRRAEPEAPAYNRQHDPSQPFVPPEAENVPRSQRMPRLDELPMPGQRQIRARDEGDAHHGVVEQKRKAGFIQRLTGVGLGRDRDERPARDERAARDPRSKHDARRDSEPAAAEPRLAPMRRQAPLPRHPAPHEEPIVRPAGPMQAADPRQDAVDDDQLEIPAFLRRQAN